MTAHFQRGAILLQQGRHADAITEFQRHLLESPEDAFTHALISICFTALEKFQAATEHAQNSIALDPEASIGFQALARSLLGRNQLKEARQAVEEALRLDPDEADNWGLLSQIHLILRDWRSAKEAADRGLTIEPDHVGCTNLRAQSLVQLGDRSAAAETMATALALSPDDSWTHANQGWSLLHANDPKKAMEHFREALRLDPENEWARAGIVEALQARNFVYRYLLRYFLWAGRLSASWQWGLMLGGYLGNRALNQLADQVPSVAPFVYPIIGIYICFAMMTWLGPSFFNLLLRFDRFGKYALSRDQRWGANLLALGLLPPLLLSILAAVTFNSLPLIGAILWFFTLLPASVIFRCDKGWPRELLAAATGVLVLLDLVATLPVLIVLGIVTSETQISLIVSVSLIVLNISIYLCIGLQFLAQYLAQQRVRT